MALEALAPSGDLFNFVIYDTISANPRNIHSHIAPSEISNTFCFVNGLALNGALGKSSSSPVQQPPPPEMVAVLRHRQNLAVQGGRRKRRRRRPRVCRNMEEAETQRMTHITVERNRRRQMNEHLTVLRSLMPESYARRGDQASIVGGAIEFVKELEHILQSLEAQRLCQPSPQQRPTSHKETVEDSSTTAHFNCSHNKSLTLPPFSQFFAYPQYTWSQIPIKYTSKSKEAIADIEVTLIETHANVRILSRCKSPRKLSKVVAGFQMHLLTILHLNVTTLGQLVLYSISAKVEEGCRLTSVDDIAGVVHRMLRMMEEGNTY